MLEFESIGIKNFLSYGNNWTSFDFKKGIYRLSGLNGHGKSTIPTDAINFALFGRPYRKIKLGQLVNTINRKNLEVYLNFRKGEDTYRIERGLKPDYFRIFKNDDIVPVSSSKRGYQELLEEDILHFNENLANQIMIKSLTKNISFMTLVKAEKRAIIENLLDIELFSVIGKNIKNKLDVLEFTLSTVKKDIDNLELLIEQELLNLEQLRIIQKKIEDESSRKVEEIHSQIAEMNALNEKYILALTKIATNKERKADLQRKVAATKEQIRATRDKQAELQADINMAQKKIKLFQGTCGDCPKIDAMIKSCDTSDIGAQIERMNDEVVEFRQDIAQKEASISKIDVILANEKFCRSGIETNNRRIEDLEKNLVIEVTKEILVDETKLKKHQKNKKTYEKQYNELANQRKHYQILKSLYSDDGIKAFIIKKYLPHINKLLNTYLRKFNTDIIFNFDQDFNEVVLSKYKEAFSYFSFSEGQKKRIDLAVLFAFINFAMFKNKKSNTNLLILDEILSGLDVEGKNRLHELLKEYRDSQNKCIITISHDSDLDIDNFDHVYKVAIEKGFSKLEKLEL
jgi:DNA repair exonuclease SbcCD ATPase subunit